MTVFRPMHGGLTPRPRLSIQAEVQDTGTYRELYVNIYDEALEDEPLVASVTIGINERGEVRVLSTVNGEGNGDPTFAIFPERSEEKAVEQC